MGSKRALMPRPWGLPGRAQPNKDVTPLTSSAPLYRPNHSKGLVNKTDESREPGRKKGPRHVHLSGKGKWDRTYFSEAVRTYGSRERSSW
ncbi:unnamed protein product [Dovyalis caffra]|uniref:Uncharacterized protein n=1 Tax=Dovyalis caffra TaxID=77055 RepID=A0AAV1RKX9_9ROSI|nr:unnamed protein product [Dovyalis caffra]